MAKARKTRTTKATKSTSRKPRAAKKTPSPRAPVSRAPAAGQIEGRHGPGTATFEGANFELVQPVAADWLPSMEERELAGRYGKVGGDPSNGDPNVAVGEMGAMRSPAGYPMQWGKSGDGSIVGPGRVIYNGVTHDDDAAVEQYKAAIGARKKRGG